MRLRYLTSGESHGLCLNAIVEGLPSGIAVDFGLINAMLGARQGGYGRGGRMQIEKDEVLIKSGVRFGVTTGAPVCLEINNKDWANWSTEMSVEPVDLTDELVAKSVAAKRITKVRPGHADFAGALKYNHEDVRNILERSSARETAARVAVGALVKCLLKEFGVRSSSEVLSVAGCKGEQDIKDVIDEARAKGDTLGGLIQVSVDGLPVGLGSFVHYDRRLDGRLAQAVMSVPAVKSVEIGAGVLVSGLSGAQTQDEIFYEHGTYLRRTNNAGGIEGGMTNGEQLVLKAAMKAIPTMRKSLRSVELDTHESYEAHFERSDTSAVEACGVVVEAMVLCVLGDAFLEKFGGDSLLEMKANYANYLNMLDAR